MTKISHKLVSDNNMGIFQRNKISQNISLGEFFYQFTLIPIIPHLFYTHCISWILYMYIHILHLQTHTRTQKKYSLIDSLRNIPFRTKLTKYELKWKRRQISRKCCRQIYYNQNGVPISDYTTKRDLRHRVLLAN